jgi:predicted ATPase
MDEGKIFDAGGRFQTVISIDEVDVPENVRLIINRRLDRLSSVQKTVLEAAAVIGRTFSFRLLSEVSQNAVDELFAVIEKAQQMGMVFSSSQGPEAPFTFVHELVRQTLLAGISIPRRQQLHAIVAIAIEGLYPNAAKEYAGEIAEHLAKAGTFAHRSARVQRTSQAAKAGRRGEIGHITKVQPLFAAIADRGR